MANKYAQLTSDKIIQDVRDHLVIYQGVFQLPDLKLEALVNETNIELAPTKFIFTAGGMQSNDICIFDLQFHSDPTALITSALKALAKRVGVSKPVAGASLDDHAFINAYNITAQSAHEQSRKIGFWEKERNDGEQIALMHSELSEGLEGLRHGNPPSDHIPDFTAIEEELADVIIRIMDMGQGRGWRIAQAVITKAAFNKTRPHKHGKAY